MKIKWSKGKEDFKDANMIRKEVFVKEQNVPIEIEIDELDDTAHHIVIYENDKPVTVGRLLEKKKYYVIGRVAVLKEYRGKKYGKVLMENMLMKAEELGANEIRLHAQFYAKNFYEKLGFEAYGKIFNEAGIDHICMKKDL
ncbi:GNAT family N-acetyltransferase [Clostridium ganghwense]|uniref:GNAT family N-acetyltransferase n=1 Tax=Clostridium ganghwense TaxID=312089 RepID=A0ABT4CQH9_9CLOT|nr:GNAT family N-acetyltransferase [Clostridium ganghwense]MCY6371315.1 GNAT family N-acetyltransferase [Clostridium ganghwense]